MKKNMSLAIMIPIFNEEKHLARVLESALKVSPYVFIVDSQSNDKSLSIASKYDCAVLQWPAQNFETSNWSTKLNWGIENNPFDTEWIMRLDADEFISDDLAISIKSFIESSESKKYDGCKFNKSFFFMKKRIKFGGYTKNYQLRMHRNNEKIYWEDRRTDEHLKGYSNIFKLKGNLIEDPILTIQEWLAKHIRYSKLEARVILLESSGESTYIPNMGIFANFKRFMKVKIYYKSPLFIRGTAYFIYRYFFLLGFLDGIRGFLYHFLHAFCYRFFVDLTIYEYKKGIYDNVTKSNDLMKKESNI